LGVIERSTASSFSQVHLVRKPDNGWRLCIDFKNLNDATESIESWPLQNIPVMIDRITRCRPKYYGKMDMTSGFFQTSIDEASRPFTAFITTVGLYQWRRLPMGLKGAASYFQRMMASEVLAGLLYIILELYLDDVLVYAESEDEFLSRLRTVFTRFRQFNITLNPKKCAFGMAEVEFVGHILKTDGVCFSPDKRTKVLDFPLPERQKQLMSFLGLVNYFRDHVKGISTMVKPLHGLITPYKKNSVISWTPGLEERYRVVQEAVGHCPMLYYTDSRLPIFVRTDASDYGIGGYIFQRDGDKEIPIRFISKALHKAQLNWSTIEKEAFAIFYTVIKFDFLLRDVKFTLETDHKNLTYLKTAQSAKVRRWQLALQEYDFTCVHIQGEHNIVADSFSRLCERPPKEEAKSEDFSYQPSHDRVPEPEEQVLSSALRGPVVTEPKIPVELRENIEKVHNSVTGHFGVEYTRKLLLSHGVNDDGLRRWVTKFIRECPVCQLRSVLNRQIKTHPFTTASYTPMEVLNIDTIGPVTKDASENSYILVVIDCFTRFVELYPVSDTSALPCARALFSHVCRYGTPMSIRSDRGSQFVNTVINQLLGILQVEHEMTLAYSKEHNSIVERANKEVMRHLTAIIFDRRISSSWSMEFLPMVQRIMNAKVHDTIGVSPAELLFGKAINLYSGLISPIPPESLLSATVQAAEGRLSDHVGKIVSAQNKLIAIARDNQLVSDSYHLQEPSPTKEVYPINSYVMYRPPSGGRTKMQLPNAGPYIVVNISGDTYSIQDLLTNKVEDTHVHNLTDFKFDPSSGIDPVEVAARNAGVYVVNKILSHRGTPKKRLDMQFLVSWKGFSDKDNTWEPYTNVRQTQAFVDYCTAHKLTSIISSKYKE
jgi:hypothetical protein